MSTTTTDDNGDKLQENDDNGDKLQENWCAQDTVIVTSSKCHECTNNDNHQRWCAQTL
jgi:hypothetical protein